MELRVIQSWITLFIANRRSIPLQIK